MILASKWLELKRKTPKALLFLVGHCSKFSDKVQTLETSPGITVKDISALDRLNHAILEEYLDIFRIEEGDKETLSAVISDIQSIVTTNIVQDVSKEKRIKFTQPYADFETSWEKEKDTPGSIQIFLQTFTTPMASFIESRVYYPLIKAIERNENAIIHSFIGSSGRRAGSLPSLKQEVKSSVKSKDKKEGEDKDVEGLTEQLD